MFCVVTGKPGGGKTKWVWHFAFRQALLGKKSLLTMFENQVSDFTTELEAFCLTEKVSAEELYNKYLCVFERTDNGVPSLPWFKSCVDETFVKEWNPDWVILDPWNQIENDTPGLSSEQQQKKDLREMLAWVNNRFGLIVVAHPTKAAAMSGEELTGYGISGSAHWENRPHYGITINRDDPEDPELEMYAMWHCWKVKHQKQGLNRGKKRLMYSYKTGQYLAATLKG